MFCLLFYLHVTQLLLHRNEMYEDEESSLSMEPEHICNMSVTCMEHILHICKEKCLLSSESFDLQLHNN